MSIRNWTRRLDENGARDGARIVRFLYDNTSMVCAPKRKRCAEAEAKNVHTITAAYRARAFHSVPSRGESNRKDTAVWRRENHGRSLEEIITTFSRSRFFGTEFFNSGFFFQRGYFRPVT